MLIERLKNISKYDVIDIRDFHLLFDHKTILLGLITQLNKENYLSHYKYYYDRFFDIRKSVLTLRNLLLKYQILQTKDIDKPIKLLEQIAINETQLLKELLNDINDETIKTNSYESHVEFIGRDEITKGKWKQLYGKLGYDIIGDTRKTEDFIQIQYFNAFNHYYSELCLSERALQTADSDFERIFAIRFGREKKDFTINLKIDNNKEIDTSLYFACPDNSDWIGNVDIFDTASNNLLYHLDVTNVKDGVYIRFKISGYVKLIFHHDGNNMAFLSGIFFD